MKQNFVESVAYRKSILFAGIIIALLFFSVGASFAQGIKNPDSDNDRLLDSLEKIFGTSSSKKDSDGDGYDDKTEIMNGYNPLGRGIWKPTKTMKDVFNKYKRGEIDQKKKKKKNNKPQVQKIINCSNANDEVKKKNVKRCMDQALKTCTPAFMETEDFFGVNKQEIFRAVGSKGKCAMRMSYKKTPFSPLMEKMAICPLDMKKSYHETAVINSTCSGNLVKALDTLSSSLPQTNGQSIGFETLASGIYKGRKKGTVVTITHLNQWDAVWNELHSDTSIRTPPPQIDLATHSIMVFFGERGDYSIRLARATKFGSSINQKSRSIISYSIERETQQNTCPAVRTLQQPFTIISFPKQNESSFEKDVRNIEREECQPKTMQVQDAAFLYNIPIFNVSLLLPDAAKYFILHEESEKTIQDGITLTLLQFLQYSAEQEMPVETFTLAVTQNQFWPKLEKYGDSNISSGAYKKLGATATHTIAWYGGSGTLGTSDIEPGRYHPEEIAILYKPLTCMGDTGKIMTYQKALDIAKSSSCAKFGKFTEAISCNNNSGGGINVGMTEIKNQDCGLACIISIDTEQAEESWMCLGGIPAGGKLRL